MIRTVRTLFRFAVEKSEGVGVESPLVVARVSAFSLVKYDLIIV